jgi:hypothetical protein
VPPVAVLVAALAFLAALLAGCTAAVSGTGSVAPPGTDQPSASPPAAAPGHSDAQIRRLRGQVREAHRLAAVVQRPDLVFASFERSCEPSGTFYDLAALTAFGGVFPDHAVPALKDNGYVTGYSQCRQSGANRSLIAAAFELESPAAARAAVAALAAALRGKGARLDRIPGFDGGYAIELSDQPDPADPKKTTSTVQRMVPHGALLNYVWAQAPDAPSARNGAARLILAQLARSRDFRVTAADRLGDLDDDPEGLRARHAELPGDVIAENGGYDLASYLALAEDPVFERKVLRRDGMTELFLEAATNEAGGRYVYRDVSLYHVRDRAAAADVARQLAALDRRVTQGIRVVRIPAMPGAFCFGNGDRYGQLAQRCFFSKGSIAVQVDVVNATRRFSDTAELHKLARAQYDLL